MKKMTKIGTHNGTFHCDEVLACFFLRQLPEYKVHSHEPRLSQTAFSTNSLKSLGQSNVISREIMGIQTQDIFL